MKRGSQKNHRRMAAAREESPMNVRTPCSPVQREVLFHHAEKLISGCLDGSAQACVDLGAVQDAVLKATWEFGAMLMQASVTEAMAEAVVWHCPECGAFLGYHDTQRKKLVTPLGVMDLARGRYRCSQCGEDYVPVDIANDLEHTGFSLHAREQVVAQAVKEPYAATSQGVSVHLPVGRESVARIVAEAADWRREEEDGAVSAVLGERDEPGPMPAGQATPLAANWRAKELPTGAVCCLSVDGGKFRTPEREADGKPVFKEGRVATISVVREGEQLPRKQAGGKLYLGRVLSAEQTMELLAAAHHLLPAPIRKLPVVFVADGGPWWEWLKVHFPKAVGVLDIFHAGEHLTKVAGLLFGESSEKTRLWRAHIREWLKIEGRLEELVEELRQAALLAGGDASSEKQAEFRRLLAYLEEHRGHMRYWEYEAQGMPLGSGGIESAIDQVLTTRLKGPGMKWILAHADNMLCLRAAALSDELSGLFQRRKEVCLALRDRFLEPLPRAA